MKKEKNPKNVEEHEKNVVSDKKAKRTEKKSPKEKTVKKKVEPKSIREKRTNDIAETENLHLIDSKVENVASEETEEAVETVKAKRERVKKKSVFLYLLDMFSMAVINCFSRGFFGNIFSSYSKEKNAFEKGFLNTFNKKKRRKKHIFSLRKVREKVSGLIENSLILNKISRLISFFLTMPLRGYGVFLTSFGLYSIMVYFLRLLVPGMDNPRSEDLFPLFAIVLLSFPLLFAKRSLLKAIYNGKITHFLFVKLFGFRSELFEDRFDSKKYKPSVMVLPGIIVGVLTVFFSPLKILTAMGIMVVMGLIISSPEIGVILSVFSFPFFSFFESPTITLALLVLFTSLSYIFKLVRGKRIFKIELIDISVLFFMVLIYFSGAITVGGIMSYHSALISVALIFGYFLVVNLLRTEAWLNRCVLSFVTSGTVVAVIGIVQYVFGLSPFDWLDESLFSDISGRTTSLFENPNVLAVYLTALLLFAVFSYWKSPKGSEKMVMLFSVLSVVVCLVLTWSRGAWIAAVIGILAFALMNSKKTIRYICLFAFATPFIVYIVPNNIINRFLSIGNLSDTSISYRIYTWKGSLKLIRDYFWGGIGYGPEAFFEVYPNYSYMGMETAEHSHSLFLQIMIAMGIAGMIVFAAIILFFFQKNFEYLRSPSDKNSYVLTTVGISTVMSFLVMGVFDYIWYNYRIFFLFWIVVAISVATVRVGKAEIRKTEDIDRSSDENFSMDIEFDERSGT